ncbi:MAG: hypothetical protein ABIX01_11940 [Chitinophagaceae bacterium]
MRTNESLPFGMRNGFVSADVPFQLDFMDDSLRTDLWNAFYIFLLKESIDTVPTYTYQSGQVAEALWIHHFREPADHFPHQARYYGELIKLRIKKMVWYEVYELFEYLISALKLVQDFDVPGFVLYVNDKLKSNNSSYTFIFNQFVPVTNDTEIEEIKLTGENATIHNLLGVQEHLKAALKLLSQKPDPDVRNVIKESISMVEVLARIIEPTESTLGGALNKLGKNRKINPTFKAGFEKLYAYTNGKNGIRHALMDDESTDIEDARFFLISCSAFTNYLIVKARKEGIFQ